MNVYLVRHGQSVVHETTNKRQSPDSSLGKTGIRQAKALAQRMKKEKIDVILSSKWDRARGTAEELSKKLGVKLELIEGIHEKEQHSELYNSELTSEIHARYIKQAEKFKNDLDWKFEGQGESLRDLINRAIKFQNHLFKHHKGQNILVVTHGLFIRAFVITALLGEKCNDETFCKIFRSISFENTAITLMEYDSERSHWELRYLNDHLHLR